ncbi:MAG: TonB-dependent receptor [Planctomycetes bacterium]|nr:TonB-dependent receptor [Planctomycetota bacterium]
MEGGSGVTTTMGNAELKPEETVSYEIGLQQELNENLALALDMYYRDVRELIGTSDEIIEIFGGSQKYARYANSDYGNIRGIALSLTKRYSNNVSGALDYTYQIAEGNSSDPNDAFNDLDGGREPEKQLIPLAWDQRHLLNLLFTYSIPDNWSLSFLATLGSGFPYTPSVGTIGDFTQNSGRKPSSQNLDMRFNKDFKLGKYYYSFFTNVYNVFDSLNEKNVFNDTGRAYYSLEEQRAINAAESGGRVDHINSIPEYYRNPDKYSDPRRVQVGLSVRF